MSEKYIVKNCPCYVNYEDKLHLCCDGQGDGECQDCTDCVIKQIITICKRDKMSKEDMKRSKEFADIIRGSKYGRDALATQVLQLFDIEEINK